ncbi:hypothetical protein ABPG72_017882 [Tetrahymena utriculariae]
MDNQEISAIQQDSLKQIWLLSFTSKDYKFQQEYQSQRLKDIKIKTDLRFWLYYPKQARNQNYFASLKSLYFRNQIYNHDLILNAEESLTQYINIDTDIEHIQGTGYAMEKEGL